MQGLKGLYKKYSTCRGGRSIKLLRRALPDSRKSHLGFSLTTTDMERPAPILRRVKYILIARNNAVKIMKQPCEYSSHRVLPTIRSVLTDVLMNEAELNQTEVSEILGISQAAVSHYASDKRGDVSVLEAYPDVEKSIRSLGRELVNGMSPRERQEKVCELCRHMQKLLMERTLRESGEL